MMTVTEATKASSEKAKTRKASPTVPSFAFDPKDPWTNTFQRGLQQAGLTGKNTYEVGIGTGINAAYLLKRCGAAKVSGSDLDPRLAELAETNVNQLAPDLAHRFHPVKGIVSLIDTTEARAAVATADAVIASLPQVGEPMDHRVAMIREHLSVPLADSAKQCADDHIAHYYPWSLFDDNPFNAVGLGLNEALLKRVRKHAPRAQVILNFGSRVGTEVIFNCFAANGYQPEKLSSQIVKQHKGTDISFFVSLEKTLQQSAFDKDFQCDFYADPEASQPLSACEAQARLDEDPDAPVFHEVCVIRGKPVAA